MKASPMQKYALRLLMAAEIIQPPAKTSWDNLAAESADSFLAPFGGSRHVIENTEIRTKVNPVSKPVLNRLGVGQNHSRKKSELEI